MKPLVRRETIYLLYLSLSNSITAECSFPTAGALMLWRGFALRLNDGISMYLFGQCVVWKSMVWQYIRMDFEFSVKIRLNFKVGEENFTKSLQLARMGTMDSIRDL